MSLVPQPLKQICFVDMPFGKKIDPKTRVEIDFDQIYKTAIAPAVEESGLECVRGDEEASGGIIHTAMFARLLLAEFVVADLTTANPNVFYELGVRHAAKPYTTVPIFATIGDLPFDVQLVRAIPYTLENGQLTEPAAAALGKALEARIQRALQGPAAKDSPLFQLFDRFPGITLSADLIDVFRDRVESAQSFRARLAAARDTMPRTAAVAALKAIQDGLGNLQTVERGALVDLFLAYRDIEGWDEMVALYAQLPADLRDAALVRQQFALALNRQNQPGSRTRATVVLHQIIKDFGESAETYGLLGRVYKDLYKKATAARQVVAAAGYLDQAIEVYTRGFECEPLDYYPGINAITLLLEKGTPEAQQEVARLLPLVSFAAARLGGPTAGNYWTVATVLELALIGGDRALAARALARAVTAEAKPWMLKSTAEDLQTILDRRRGTADTADLEAAVAALLARAAEGAGEQGSGAAP